MTEGPEEREKHVPPLHQPEAAVLEVVDAPEVVGRNVFLRRVRIPGDAATAELIGVLAVADQRDVPDRLDPSGATDRGRGGGDQVASRGLRVDDVIRLDDNSYERPDDCD